MAITSHVVLPAVRRTRFGSPTRILTSNNISARGFVQLQPILVPFEKQEIFASRKAEFSKIPPTPDCAIQLALDIDLPELLICPGYGKAGSERTRHEKYVG